MAIPNLLLVDDDRLILSTVANGLREFGYRVSSVDSLDDAEEHLSMGNRPDMVLLDLNLPKGHGLDLVDSLRDLDNIPFVVFSAYSDARTVERATEVGALGYMVKPLDVPQMVPTIEAALVRARELSQLRATGEQLQTALDSERNINVAVGITMMQHKLSRDDAFKRLRATARTQRRKLADLATDIVRSIEVLHNT